MAAPKLAARGLNKSFVKDGKITESGLAALKSKMPHADVSSLESDPRVENIQSLFTVKMMVNFIAAKLG